jgi:hypothetical protein
MWRFNFNHGVGSFQRTNPSTAFIRILVSQPKRIGTPSSSTAD